MQHFEGRLAVVTGGGSGMGRELTRQLAAAGCNVAAICDVSETNMAETCDLALADAAGDVMVSAFAADVSEEQDLVAFRSHLQRTHHAEALHLLFNNAGIGGGGSFVADDRAEWEKVFGVCWGGVYLGIRTFLPMLMAADEGHIVNTSSINGFWASMGPATPHTAYSAAKFAIKGLTEALITDFRVHAPHLRVSVVMPGHIGTSIGFNSGSYFGRHPKDLTEAHLAQLRERLAKQGIDASGASDEDLRTMIVSRAEAFRDDAPTTAAQAAAIILDGVRNDEWRILVGPDAHEIDVAVRNDPTSAYEPTFLEALQARGLFGYTRG